jgi:penicillin-binding protein 2
MLELGTGQTTAGKYLRNLPVKVAAKTGTSQETRMINGKPFKFNNGIFISFAPYDNPEIAVIAVGEGCKSAEPVIPTIRDIYEYYFGSLNQMDKPQRENVLL